MFTPRTLPPVAGRLVAAGRMVAAGRWPAGSVVNAPSTDAAKINEPAAEPAVATAKLPIRRQHTDGSVWKRGSSWNSATTTQKRRINMKKLYGIAVVVGFCLVPVIGMADTMSVNVSDCPTFTAGDLGGDYPSKDEPVSASSASITYDSVAGSGTPVDDSSTTGDSTFKNCDTTTQPGGSGPTNAGNPGSDDKSYLYDNYVRDKGIAAYCQGFLGANPGKKITGDELDVLLHDYYVVTGAGPTPVLLSEDQTIEYSITWAGNNVNAVAANTYARTP